MNSFFRSLPRSLMNVAKFPRRNLLEVPTVRSEILVCRSYLHPKDWIHVQVMNKEEFLDLYKSEWPLFVVKDRVSGIMLRLLSIVPFMIKEDEILPFPFVVDTGASGTMYLGRKMKKTLEELNVLHEVASFQGPYGVHGTFTWKERTLANPVVNLLPSHHEIDGEDDIRVNILGLEAIAQLGLLEPIMDLSAV